jgi:hypothetical protein
MRSSTPGRWSATVSPAAEGQTPWVSAPSIDSSLGTKLLPTVLSVTAGSVDVISFLGLDGLFTAHITGNLVILAAHVVSGDPAQLGPMLSVPVFMAVLVLTRLLAGGLERIRIASLRPLLLLQFLLLAGFVSASLRARVAIQTRQTWSLPACSAFRRWPCRTRSCRSR